MKSECSVSSNLNYIVFSGPDGCGKTSLADALQENLESAEVSVSRYEFSFRVLPSLSRLIGRKRINLSPAGQEGVGMVRPLTTARASLLAIWYGLDHVAGRFLLRSSTNAVSISARSYHDFFYQRAYLRAPRWLIRAFVWLGPKPSLLIVPIRSSQEIFSVKPELSPSEIDLQYDRISAALCMNEYFLRVDASIGLAKTSALIYAKTLEKLGTLNLSTDRE